MLLKLQQGDIIVTKRGSKGMLLGNTIAKLTEIGKGPMSISDITSYSSDLKHEEFEEFDITKVYRLKKKEINYSVSTHISTIIEKLDNDFLDLIWEREREIDWRKVPKFTKVEVKHSEKSKWINKYFIKYIPSSAMPYVVSSCDDFTYYGHEDNECYKYIRIYDKNEILENWYKGE